MARDNGPRGNGGNGGNGGGGNGGNGGGGPQGNNGKTVIDGTAGDDTLLGGNGKDVLNGLAGDDTLDGGNGKDTMAGGAGDDTYIVNQPREVIIENANEGIDTVVSRTTYTLGNNLENLTLTGPAAIKGTGNALDNVITGNANRNTLKGLAGDDTLDGGGGRDTLDGGAGDDTFIVNDTQVRIIDSSGNDTVQSSITFTLATGLENLVLTGTADINGTGNAADNVIRGNAGVNILTGLAGNDTLDGGPGDDTVRASIDFTLSDNVENLTLTGTADIDATGNAGNNTLRGNAGANVLNGLGGNDSLDGGAGADTMNGGAGDDRYVVDNAGDLVNELPGEGSDTVFSSVSFTLGGDVENLTLTGAANLTAAGNGLANTITGNDGNNSIVANGGNDLVHGGLGDDRIYSGAGADVTFGDGGADSFIFKATTAYGSVDTVGDFNVAENDNLDISDLLTAFDPLTMALTDWVRISDAGADSIVEVDRDGSGAGFGFTQIATLSGVTGLTDEAALVTSGNLLIA